MGANLARFDGQPCPYCMQSMHVGHQLRYPSMDHIIPRCRGGDKGRRVCVCQQCNNERGNMNLLDWYHKLTETKDPRAGHVGAFLRDIGYWEDVINDH